MSEASKDILVVGEFDFEGGGPYRSLLRIVTLLADHGFKVHVVTTPGAHRGITELASEKSSIVYHKNFPFIVRPKVSFLKPLAYLLEALLIDRYLCKGPFNGKTMVFSLISPGRFLWRWPTKYRALYIFRSYTLGPFHRLAGPYFRKLIPINSRLLGVSEYTIKTIANSWGLGYPAPALGFLRNSTGDRALEPREYPKVRKKVLMAGRVHKDKNPFFWIEVAAIALKKSNFELEFEWIGDGPLINKAREEVARLGLSEHIRFPGFISNAGRNFADASIYLHLASVEPMSNALIEALKFGLPCVATSAGGNPEAVIDGLNGSLVSGIEPEEAANEVIRLLDSEALYLSFSRNAVEIFNSRFSAEILVNRLLNEINRARD